MTRNLTGWALWGATGGLVLATLAGMISRLGVEGGVGWGLDLLSHWPKHLALAGLVVAAIAGVRRMRLAAGLAALVVAANGALVIGLGGFALPQAAPAGAQVLRVASANIHGSMAALEKLSAAAKDYGADVVSAYEAPEDLTDADMARLFPDFARRVLPSERLEGWKMKRRSLIAARGAGDVDVTAFMGSHGVILRAGVDGVQIVTTHPPSPGAPDVRWDRDRQLASIAQGLDTEAPFVIMGDFNTTPWGHAYTAVPGERAGDPRFEGTFPAIAGPLGLPIDHVKFGGGLVLTDYRVGPDIGSDHLPLFATFALPAR